MDRLALQAFLIAVTLGMGCLGIAHWHVTKSLSAPNHSRSPDLSGSLKIDFKSGETENSSRLKGFSVLEGFGRWTIAKYPIIYLPEPLAGNLRISILGRVLQPNSGVPIKVEVGGRSGFLEFTEVESLKTVELSNVNLDRQVKLQIPYPTSPFWMSGVSDKRLLGLGVSEIVIERINL